MLQSRVMKSQHHATYVLNDGLPGRVSKPLLCWSSRVPLSFTGRHSSLQICNCHPGSSFIVWHHDMHLRTKHLDARQ